MGAAFLRFKWQVLVGYCFVRKNYRVEVFLTLVFFAEVLNWNILGKKIAFLDWLNYAIIRERSINLSSTTGQADHVFGH